MIKFLSLPCILLLLTVYACTSAEEKDPLLAEIGDQDIRYSEFYENFSLYPEFRNNSTVSDARLQHLRYMIKSKLMANAARQDSLIDSKEIQQRLTHIYNQELLKELYRRDVLDQIDLTDQELWEEYKRSNIEVKIRHLFAATRQTANDYYRRLQQGDSFEDLARECFDDSLLSANGGDLGFIRLTDLDPLLVDSVYTQRIGSYSRPLRSSYGFHIIKVDDVKRAIFLTEDEFRAKKELYASSLKSRRARVRSSEYLAETLQGKSVTVKQRVLDRLLRIARQSIKARQQTIVMFTPEVTDNELRTISARAADITSQVLVQFSGGQWTVADYLQKVEELPTLQRPSLTNKEKMIKSLIDMVRDQYLLQIAGQRGIAQLPELQRRVRYEQDLFLADEYRKRIMMVSYKEENPQLWQQRRERLATLEKTTEVEIDTTALYHDLAPAERQQKIPRIRTVIRERYLWE